MKSFSGIIGWLLLVVVLAVPSVLFYNWWTGTRKSEAPVQASTQRVSTAAIFTGAQDKPAAQPAAQAAAAAEAPVFQPAPVQPAVQSPPAPPATSAEPMASAPRAETRPVEEAPIPAAGPLSVARSTAADQGEAGAVPARTAPGSYFSPKSDRDPTMTPGDYQKIKDEERSRLENERMRQLALHKQRKVAGGESRIRLQGVVGNSVIINGEMYSVGDTVAGVKVLKIGPDYLIGEYKGKKFKKILQ